MPLTRLLPGASPVSATPGDRDRAVDVARLSALVVVMFGHCALLLATLNSDGLWIGNILGELPALTPITWVVQVMPLFFFAGGAAGAYGWHSGATWGAWLVTRTQRLCRPVFWYFTFWTAALVVARLVLGDASADRLGRECVALLWFLGVYLVVMAFVPALTRLSSPGAVAVTVGGLVVLAAGIDQIRFAVGSPEAGVPNFLVVWLIPVVIGVGYARRLIRPAVALVTAAVALTAQVLLVVFGPYAVALVTTGSNDGVSNVSPPTLLLAVHCIWMSCVFVAAAGLVGNWAEHPRVWYLVAVGNGGAMTLYLWHIPAIAVATFGLNAFGLDAYDVHAPDFWGMLALRAVVFTIVMFATFLLLSPLEHRKLPWWDGPVAPAGGPGQAGMRVRATVAGVLVCLAGVAMLLVAKNGLAGADGWIPLLCFLAAVLSARALAGSVREVR